MTALLFVLVFVLVVAILFFVARPMAGPDLDAHADTDMAEPGYLPPSYSEEDPNARHRR